MKRIIDPYAGRPEHNCFGCSPRNPIGLHLEFFEDGEWLVARWHPSADYEGWHNVVHGGIQALLLDEICAWVVMRKLQTIGVTSRMETRYLAPVTVDNDLLTVRARVTRQVRNIVEIESSLYDDGGKLCTQAVCHYYTFPPERARAERDFAGCRAEGEE